MLKIEQITNSFIVSFTDDKRINIVIAGDLKKELLQIVSVPGRSLILDLTGIRFIDSEGFNTLTAVRDAAGSNNSFFKLSNVSSEVKELFDLKELTGAFELSEADVVTVKA